MTTVLLSGQSSRQMQKRSFPGQSGRLGANLLSERSEASRHPLKVALLIGVNHPSLRLQCNMATLEHLLLFFQHHLLIF